MLKRLFDIIVAFFGLVLLSPVLVVISLLIKFSMGSPIFFLQERVGQHGRIFWLCKFRSMVLVKEASKGSFNAGDTSIITHLGRILRKTKMDELPQLINVLKGEMSIVGPRPEVKKWVDIYPERWKKILTVRPGITDNASLEFRNEEEFLVKSRHPEVTYKKEILPKKLDLYEEYVKTRSFMGDIKIILRTIFVVITK